MLEQFFEIFDKLINEIVKDFDDEYSAYLSDKFSADITNNKIAYPLLIDPVSTKEFRDNFVSRFPTADNYSDFLLSLLHEIGHLETVNDMENDIEKRKKIISNKKYFNLFNERIATDWAGFWLEDNEELARQLDDTIIDCLTNKLFSLITD